MISDHNFGTTGTAANSSPLHLGRTATHEVGHWLNLLHTHEQPGCDDPNNCFITGDCCCDTPPQSMASFFCQTGSNTCNTDQPDLPDPVSNYMTYSDDACMNMFTSCQSSRMNLCLDSVRKVVWSFAGGDCPVFKVVPTEAEFVDSELRVFPNPISENTAIELRLADDELVSISVCDLQGRIISQLHVNDRMKAGLYRMPFPSGLSAGQYFLQVRIGNKTLVKSAWVI